MLSCEKKVGATNNSKEKKDNGRLDDKDRIGTNNVTLELRCKKSRVLVKVERKKGKGMNRNRCQFRTTTWRLGSLTFRLEDGNGKKGLPLVLSFLFLLFLRFFGGNKRWEERKVGSPRFGKF